MEDNQREAMFKAWERKKIKLEPLVTRTEEYCIVKVEFNGETFLCKALQSTMFGSTNTYNYAFNRVLSDLRNIDNDIELKYDISLETTIHKIEPEPIVEPKKKEIETIVINLFGAPGCGKSTLASSLFAHFKKMGVDIELVSEYAKELVWEERFETMKDEVYIFGKQQHRFHRLKGKTRVIITDRPIALSKFYNDKYGRPSNFFNGLVDEVINEYENFNIFLKRGSFNYNPDGRVQSEEESNTFEEEMTTMFLKDIDILSSIESEILDSITEFFKLKSII